MASSWYFPVKLGPSCQLVSTMAIKMHGAHCRWAMASTMPQLWQRPMLVWPLQQRRGMPLRPQLTLSC